MQTNNCDPHPSKEPSLDVETKTAKTTAKTSKTAAGNQSAKECFALFLKFRAILQIFSFIPNPYSTVTLLA